MQCDHAPGLSPTRGASASDLNHISVPSIMELFVLLQARVREVELEDVRNAYQGLATEHRRLQANIMQVGALCPCRVGGGRWLGVLVCGQDVQMVRMPCQAPVIPNPLE